MLSIKDIGHAVETKCFRKFEIKADEALKAQEFYTSLKELVTILFAVVVGIGLEELSDYHLDSFLKLPSFYWYLLANAAIAMSWWGYHQGIIFGPKEKNVLCYIIDYLLVVIYWILINKRDNLKLILACYFLMFFLYLLWEWIRFTSLRENKIKEAVGINLTFATIFLSLFITSLWFHIVWIYLVLTCCLIIIYRKVIHSIYVKKKEDIPTVKTEVSKITELISIAQEVAINAKSHISKFGVGAALLTRKGSIYRGCNVEFDNFSNTIHAEESVLCQMIKDGDREPQMIAVFTSTEELNFPCGMCRQSLYELGGPGLIVVACNPTRYESKTMQELMPNAFTLE